MIVELGNHDAKGVVVDAKPKVTTIHIPEADEAGLGGYTHDIAGVKVGDFKAHLLDSMSRDGITRLPGQEILLSILHPTDGAWNRHAGSNPKWVNVIPHDLTPSGRGDDIQAFLEEFWGVTDEKPANVEDLYHTRFGPPGEGPPLGPPLITNLFTNDGRSISNINDGGGQIGATGVGTAATGTTFTSAATWTTNQWTGYRLVAFNTAGAGVWGNVVSNTNAAAAGVATVDRWYNFATPGGAAGTTPANGWYWAMLDGGMTSTWFVGLATGVNAPAAADHTLATGGNVEIVTGGGGLIRKIAPYAQTSGVASRAITLTPVFTANGSDALPATVTTIGVFSSMVVGFGGAGGPMKFETALSASATFAASGDQMTVTETITGS